MATLKELRNERTTTVTALRALAEKADEAGRQFTNAETAQVDAKTQRLEELNVEIRQAEKKNAEVGAQLEGLRNTGGSTGA